MSRSGLDLAAAAGVAITHRVSTAAAMDFIMRADYVPARIVAASTGMGFAAARWKVKVWVTLIGHEEVHHAQTDRPA